MKVLITGFDPFGGEKINPAWEAVNAMQSEISGAQIIKLQIPTVFNKSIEVIKAKMDEINPDVVISIGQAGGRFAITPERIAMNLSDGRIPDNAGYQPVDVKVFNDGPAAYFSLLPIKQIVKAIKEQNIPAEISNTAGSYVCNHVMYGVLYHVHHSYPKTIAGFIHVPYVPEQVLDKKNTPSMSLANIVTALETAVKVIAK